MPFISEVNRAEASPDIAAMYDRIFGVGRDPVADPGTSTGTPGNWWTIWARTPNLLNFFRHYSYNDAKLAADLRGLVLARTGYIRESRFVYSQHCKTARGAAGETLLWLISDDNFNPLQRNILMLFELAK